MLIENFITIKQEETLIDFAKTFNNGDTIIPNFCHDLIKDFIKPDVLKVIKYEPGDFLTSHVDPNIWGPKIVNINLGCDATIKFASRDKPDIEILLPRRSLFIIEGEMRFCQ